MQVGPRPYFLVEDMDPGGLKTALQNCASRQTFSASDFSIGHRGAPLQFPEHTKESYEAAARMGAGIIECDVTFTADRQLVCRHAQCDLHTTTNILALPELAAKCSQGFTPASIDPASGKVLQPATARCCASDITLAEFKTLCGKMDAADERASRVADYLDGTAGWRTDLYAGCATLLSHAESIQLIKALRRKFTPELKKPEVAMPYQGDYTQQDYARQLIEEYRAAGIAPQDVWPQSFNLDDVRYWITETPAFGAQAVYLDGRRLNPNDPAGWHPSMTELAAAGVNVIAPPLPLLVTLNADKRIVPSAYAVAARSAGLDIITWTLERSGPLRDGGGFYYRSVAEVIDNDGDMMTLLDVLAREVGVIGVFSDWPGTVTYYANCMGL